MNPTPPNHSPKFKSLQSVKESLLDLILFNELKVPGDVCGYLLTINPSTKAQKYKHCPKDCPLAKICGTYFFTETFKLKRLLKTYPKAFTTYDSTYLQSLLNYLSPIENGKNILETHMASLKYYLLNYNTQNIKNRKD